MIPSIRAWAVHCLWMPCLLVVGVNLTAEDRPADLVITDGKIVTLDKGSTTAEALAVRGDRIIAVGSNTEIESFIGDATRTLRVNGKLVLPGFIEGHGHFVSLGESKMILDLTQAQTWDEIVRLVVRKAEETPAGQWIVGRGWHQSKWRQTPEPQVQGYPTNSELSRRTPHHPVLLTHASGHMVIANARALELARLSPGASNSGGDVLRDEAGRPTGVLRENAAGPVRRAYARSQWSRSAKDQQRDLLTAIQLATKECLAHGVTSFHDAGASFATVDVLRDLAEQGKLQTRLWIMLSEDNDALARRMADYRMIGVGQHHLTVRAIKRLIDGALGTHGAWLLEPYDDLPTSIGHNTTSPASIRRTAELALQHDYQVCVHAIGDRANRVVLDLFEEVAGPSANDRRWRIEHAQHVHPDDMSRFAQLGVIAAMQGNHCTSDAPFVATRLGQRRAAQSAYAWRSMLDRGAILVNGTDVPVERVDPIACFYASVTRKTTDGAAFYPEQRMTREEALRSYTRNAAFAAFEEDLKGSLEPGKLADMVVLSKDLLTIDESEIRDTRVLYTIIGGKIL